MRRMIRFWDRTAIRGKKPRKARSSIWKCPTMVAMWDFPRLRASIGRNAGRWSSWSREDCQASSACDAWDVTNDVTAACQRAIGFLELGMPEDALAELEQLPGDAA